MKRLLHTIRCTVQPRVRGQTTDWIPHPESDPASLFMAWYQKARSTSDRQRPGAMTLATCGDDARPSARIVICKAVETDPLALIFFTRYCTRKANQLAQNPHAAALFYWPDTKRQARIEGHVIRLSGADSRSYFPALSFAQRRRFDLPRVSEDASSRQSPVPAITSKATTQAATRSAGGWGAYRLVAGSIELWVSRGGLAHTSVRWVRTTSRWIVEKSTHPSTHQHH